MNGTNRAAIRPGESAVVFGAGAIGCLFIAVLRASGAATDRRDRAEPKRAPVARAVGADEVLTPEDWASHGAPSSCRRGADVVVDAVGSVLPQAIEAAAMGARVVMFGMNGNARPPVHQVEIVEKGLSILGSTSRTSRSRPRSDSSRAASSISRPMISADDPARRHGGGIDRIRSGEAVKIVITP